MSPLPDRFHQPSKQPLPNQPHDNEQPSAASELATGVPAERSAEPSEDVSSVDDPKLTEDQKAEDQKSAPLVPKRPLMRPVSRPQPPDQTTPPPLETQAPPAQPASIQKPAAVAPAASQVSSPTANSSEPTSDEAADQAAIRQQPIPPPSEPKQYRAIGLLRGRYTPSEEQFTRGNLVTSDGTEIEAVLLGRVMSLVRNHLDLEQEHLWVVYPRTREMTKNLHAQIVGVWEPEKLNKTDADADAEETSPDVDTSDELTSPGFDDNYFSIRGEIVFHSPEEEQIVVKIQQAPRKSSDKEKAFKLRLEGVLPSSKVLGYFWDLQVERRETSLVIIGGSSIGLVPPKKKSAADAGRERRPFRKMRDPRPGASRGVRPMGSAVPTRREPPPKPVKRTEPSSEG